jgi:hypothetical protein
MNKWGRVFAGRGADIFGLCVFAAAALIAFWSALPLSMALLSPDSGPFYVFAHRTSLIERFLGGAAFTPHVLYWMALPPLAAHDLTYVLDSLILALAGVYYLRGRGVGALAAWFGGLALGLCGYTFTLFAAGHRGYYHMFSCAAWSFGLLIRCFERRSLLHFAALGLVFAWGATCQPDVLVLVGLVAASYALWLTFQRGPGEDGRLKQAGRRIASVWPRFAVSIVFLGLAGFGSLRSAMTTTMASRDAQIKGVSELSRGASAAASAAPSEQERRERWQFATGWSLPPEDVLEFVAPGVFGNESMQKPYPYWGRLGRAPDEVFQKGRMMPNFRGHTVYLGVISVLFALLALAGWLAARGRAGAGALPAAAATDVPFWACVWLVCLVLAMGRYTPVYRAFYALPYMDYIRAPVKFHHLVELATAMLAGFGMDAFLRERSLRRRLAWLSAAGAGLLTVCAGVMLANKGAVVSHIASLGLGPLSEALGGYAVQSLMRSAVLAAFVGGLAWWASRLESGRAVAGVSCALLAALGLELGGVASRYVHAVDVSPFYRANAVVAAIKREARDRFVNVVSYVSPNAWAQDWFSTALASNGIRNLMPGADEREAPAGKLFAALSNDPLRLWRLCGVEYVMLPRKGSEGLVRAGVLEPVLDFELGQGVVRQVSPSADSFLLARVRGVKSQPRLVGDWAGGIAAAGQSEAVGSVRPDVTDAPPPASAGPAEAGEVRVLAWRGWPATFSTRLRVSARAPGLLIFNERAPERVEILVDGRAVEPHVADCCWPAALVPAGEHEVVLRQMRNAWGPSAGCAAAAAALIWGLVAVWRAQRANARV